MPSKVPIYIDLAAETARQISSDEHQWMAFLETAGRLYKYNYQDQLLIFAQKPDATACAEYELWNQRMHRYVRKGTRGIGLLTHGVNGTGLRYVFDVADTGTRHNSLDPQLWQVNENNLTAVFDMLTTQYGVPTDEHPSLFDHIAAQLASDYWNEHQSEIVDSVDGSFLMRYDEANIGNAFRKAAEASISYMIQARCGLHPEGRYGRKDFISIFDWNTPRAIEAVGTAVSDATGQVLRQIEVAIRTAERSVENDRAEVQESRGLSAAGPGREHGGAEQAAGQVRNDEAGVPGGAQADSVQSPVPDREADGAPAGDRGDGEREAGAGHEQPDAPPGNDEDDGSDGLGSPDEQPESTGRGNDLLGADLRLTDAEPAAEQMSFLLSEQDQIRVIDTLEAESATNTPFAFSFDQSIVDSFLLHGSNTDNHRVIIALDYLKQKPVEAIAEHLRQVYHGGYGLNLVNGAFSAWYDDNGIHIARGKASQYSSFAQHITWEDAARRIGHLMGEGQFLSMMEMATAPAFERRQLSEALWYMSRDIAGDRDEVLPSLTQMKGGGFPEEVARLADLLSDPSYAQQLTNELRAFVDQYKADPDLMRFRFHSPQRILIAMEELALPRQAYDAWIPEHPAPSGFITQDEIHAVLGAGSSVSGGKGRVYQFFTQRHTAKEKADMLKHEYGIGGRSHGVSGASHSSENHDAKGISLTKQYCQEVKMAWPMVAGMIDDLIRRDRFLSAKEKETLIPQQPDPEKEYQEFNEPPVKLETIVLDLTGRTAEEAEPVQEEVIEDAPEEEFLDIDFGQVKEQLDAAGFVDGEFVDPDAIAQAPIVQEAEAVAAAQETPESVPFLTAYSLHTGDTVYLNQTPFDITQIGAMDVELHEHGSSTIIFRAESRERLEQLLPLDERNNRYLIDQTPQIQPETAGNYHITDDHLGEGGAKTKFARNIAAIRTLQQIENEHRTASPDEQEVLSQYVGWGGMPQAFDPDNADWHNEYMELKGLLTQEEYEMARASTLNAHYTSPTVIRAIYDAVERMGFKSGNVLEPSCGVGNFFGVMPDSLRDSRLYGVELDSLTGRIARQLYPEADITISGFEKTDRKDFYDLAVGNVPFGSYKLQDRQFDRHNFLIHDYFFAKAIDQVRPGGVIAFITSKGTMDKQSPEVRKYIAQRAELLGAIRLPNTAFRANAGTEVTSDILFLQKRERPIEIEPDWVHLGRTPDGIPVNSYFADHPEMVLGKMEWDDSMYGGRTETACVPVEGAVLSEQLAEAVQHIAGEYHEAELPDLEEGSSGKTISADPNVANYSFTLVDGEVYFRTNSIMTQPDLSQAAKERVRGLIGLRDCVHDLIQLQLDNGSDDALKEGQERLNTLYDQYTAKYGLINSRGNANAFSADASYYLLCSLEDVNDKGELLHKADMFTKRTIRKHQTVDHVETSQEALAVSIAEKAGVDLEYMAALSGKPVEQIIDELHGAIYPVPNAHSRTPLHETYVTADEYLSGNVRQKLREAREAAQANPLYEQNVAALEAAIPKDLDASEIDVRLGATWIDKEYITRFMHETFSTPAYLQRYIEVQYSPYTAEWGISGKTAISDNNVAAYVTYGTDRTNAYRILEDTLNLRDVRIYDTVTDADGTERRVLNQKATTLAQQKQQAIKDAFREWIWRDPTRREVLTTKYNEIFNATRPREYDGSHIVFGGMTPAITLREHQRNAVAHILYGGNTLLAHQVGAGKTFEMVAAAMESKRLGLCQKPMFVVPNHLTEQWASEFMRLYPSAHILVATKKDFEKANRQKFCARIATGDYDAVIIGHSQFERIPVSQARQERLIHEQIAELTEGIMELKRHRGEQFSVKQLERSKRMLESRLKKLEAAEKKDHVVTFEELGVDRLYVDEAHSFKNLMLATKMRNVAGLSQSESQKSTDMFLKCRYMDELTGGRGTVFATGTPVSNSMTELYTMQRYLQYNTLGQRSMTHFDCWASTFGETTTAIELAPEGTGYRARTRFAKFFNLPELMTLFKEVADIKTADQLHLPTPNAHYETVVVHPSEQQKEMVKALSERAAVVHSGSVDPSVDNMLRITSDGRKLGLDQRLINPLLPDDPNSKVNACVRNVFRIWQDGQEDKLTQLVFCDLSTPRGTNTPVPETDPAAGAVDAPEIPEGAFNVYDDIRNKLVAMGVPREQIAFIHEANTEARKKELFAKVRTGEVRVLMGSTAKMGAGTNVQDRLVASHDLDCPWRPGDLEQRAGRIVRQGNQNKDVHIYRYVTESTFDAYLWQTIEHKQRFISQIMTSKSPVRSCEDVDETALSYAEIKALCAGDPRIKQKMDLDVDVARLRLMKADHQSKQFRLEDQLLKEFPQQIEQDRQYIAGFEHDLETLAQHPLPQEDFVGMEVHGTVITDKEEAGKAILEACKVAAMGKPVEFGNYRGLELRVEYDSFSNHFHLYMKGAMHHKVEVGTDPRGNLLRMENAIAGIPERMEKVKARLATTEQQMEAAKAELGKPFPQEAELRAKSEKLAELDAALNMDHHAPQNTERVSVRQQLHESCRPGQHRSNDREQAEVR